MTRGSLTSALQLLGYSEAKLQRLAPQIARLVEAGRAVRAVERAQQFAKGACNGQHSEERNESR